MMPNSMSTEQANDSEPPQGGVLAALPRTRPQRASARRASARAKAQSETATPARTKAKPKSKAKAKATATATATAKKKPAKRRPPRPVVEERAPKQGYEPEEEVELGNTVHPPSGGELIESLADIVGELAGASATAGGRLLRDALSIFRRP